jgi:hypothetical protein
MRKLPSNGICSTDPGDEPLSGDLTNKEKDITVGAGGISSGYMTA